MCEVKQVIIDGQIPGIKFACNLSACKGACCTLAGGTGAPLLDEELEQIERSFPLIKDSLSLEHLDTIAQFGLYEGHPGFYTTMCFNNRACVFVVYEDGIARCSFEKAFVERKLKWRKPISCHLFPIRAEYGTQTRLRYQRITECDPALNRGEQEQILLGNFLMEPLIRAFGSSWYNEFKLIYESEHEDPKTEKANIIR
jgi:hypothetical protein